MKVNWEDYFIIRKQKDKIHNGTYYKIIDKQTNRFCYATPLMLKEVVVILLKCIINKNYKVSNNHSIDFKVSQIFLDDDKFEKAKRQKRIDLRTSKLKHEISEPIRWKLVNEYLAERG